MTTRADLEARFIKRFSSRRFAALLNSAEGMAPNITTELKDKIQELTATLDPGTRYLIPVACEEAELSVVTATHGKALHRALYQQSLFFRDIVIVGVSKSSGITLHTETNVVGTVGTRKIDDLDAFNQYVLLHFFDYFKKYLNNEEAQEKDSGAREALKDVVIDKISVLRDPIDPSADA